MSRFAMVKIVDVAAAAGCSVATVSRVLNGNARVDPALAAAVREAADRLGYRPNAVARHLRRQRTNLWLLVISDIENPFFTAVARGVADVAHAAGFRVALCNADEDPAKEAEYLALAADERAAGVILSPHAADVDLERLGDIPLVAIDRSPVAAVDLVRTDSRGGARAATAHLLAAGWCRVACITGPASAETAQLRRAGFLDAVREFGAGVPAGSDGREVAFADPEGDDDVDAGTPAADAARVMHQPFGVEGGRVGVAALLDGPDPPDALFVANSALTLGVLAELRDRRLVPGRDIGLVCFDDAPWAPLVDPPLTVVSQPAYEVGRRAADLLADRIRAAGSGSASSGSAGAGSASSGLAGPESIGGGSVPAAVGPPGGAAIGGSELRRIVLPTELIIRESSRRG